MGCPQAAPVVKNPPTNAGDMRHGFDPWVRKIPWRRSLSITNSQSSLKLMSIKSVMPSSYLILCPPLLLHTYTEIKLHPRANKFQSKTFHANSPATQEYIPEH